MSADRITELRALIKSALEVANEIGAGEGSRPSSPVAPDGPEVLADAALIREAIYGWLNDDEPQGKGAMALAALDRLVAALSAHTLVADTRCDHDWVYERPASADKDYEVCRWCGSFRLVAALPGTAGSE